MADRFNLHPTHGPALRGVLVHGSGGPTNADGLRRAIVLYQRGRSDVGLVQPLPSHVAAYTQDDRSDERAVSLDGLRWEVAT